MGSTMRALSRGVSPDVLLVKDPASGTGPSAALRRLVPRSIRRDHDSSSTLIADSAAVRDLATPEAEWQPQARLVAAVESVRTERTHRSVFSCAKVVQVLSGRARIETEEGPHLLGPGMNFMIGAGRWCSIVPLPSVRMWTVYLDEEFLRHHMWWVFAGRERVGVPAEWDGSAVVSHIGVELIRRVEPVWRQISTLDRERSPEASSVRQIELFARALGIVLPALLNGSNDPVNSDDGRFPVEGTLVTPPAAQIVQRAVATLRTRMAEPWTGQQLASEVAVSRAHLTRLFEAYVGVPPMRFLTESRLTEFTRLIEETDLPVAVIARNVGWADGRIAAKWFRRRFGKSPARYRAHPHPNSGSLVPGPACSGC